jgi:hypothetical protein
VDNHYRLVGECYVHGTMHGEVITNLEADKLKDE